MTIAASYAKALHDLVTKDASNSAAYIKNLAASLQKRGHIKLMPAIVSEYQKLDIQAERSKQHSKVTPEKERTRVLLGLYKKLVETK